MVWVRAGLEPKGSIGGDEMVWVRAGLEPKGSIRGDVFRVEGVNKRGQQPQEPKGSIRGDSPLLSTGIEKTSPLIDLSTPPIDRQTQNVPSY
jgi:hypothetical protein